MNTEFEELPGLGSGDCASRGPLRAPTLVVPVELHAQESAFAVSPQGCAYVFGTPGTHTSGIADDLVEGKRVGADDDAVGDGKFASHFGFRFFLSSVCEV